MYRKKQCVEGSVVSVDPGVREGVGACLPRQRLIVGGAWAFKPSLWPQPAPTALVVLCIPCPVSASSPPNTESIARHFSRTWSPICRPCPWSPTALALAGPSSSFHGEDGPCWCPHTQLVPCGTPSSAEAGARGLLAPGFVVFDAPQSLH